MGKLSGGIQCFWLRALVWKVVPFPVKPFLAMTEVLLWLCMGPVLIAGRWCVLQGVELSFWSCCAMSYLSTTMWNMKLSLNRHELYAGNQNMGWANAWELHVYLWMCRFSTCISDVTVVLTSVTNIATSGWHQYVCVWNDSVCIQGKAYPWI